MTDVSLLYVLNQEKEGNCIANSFGYYNLNIPFVVTMLSLRFHILHCQTAEWGK